MNSFFKQYSLSSPAPVSEARLSKIAEREPWKTIAAGTYNEGELTICHEGFQPHFMESWHWLTGDHAYLICILSFGDFIYFDASESVFYIVLLKNFSRVRMGNNFEGIFDVNCCAEIFRKEIIKPNLVKKYVAISGAVEYGEILFFPTAQSCVPEVVNAEVRLDILGQTGFPT